MSAPRRLLLTGVLAVLLVGGLVTWRVLDQAAPSSTIPASFDGRWVGDGVTREGSAEFTATLGEDLMRDPHAVISELAAVFAVTGGRVG